MSQEPTDLRPAGTALLAVSQLGFGAAETGGLNHAVWDQAAEPIVRHPVLHADLRAEGLIRDDAPTPA